MHVPVFLNRQVLVNFSPALTMVLSGTVISETNTARLHLGSSVADGSGVIVDVKVGVKVCVMEGVTVGVLLGVNVTV